VRGPVLEASRYLELMRQDKKAERGAIRFVLLDALGVPVLRQAPDQAVRAAIERRSSA
jgi:3-dehydroquinate synthase